MFAAIAKKKAESMTDEQMAFEAWYKATNSTLRETLGTGSSAMPTGKPFAIVAAHFQAPARIRVNVLNAFSIKDALKTDGYKFDGQAKAWVRDFDTIGDAVEAAKALGVDARAKAF